MMITAMKSLSAGCDHGRFELHLVGGFIDQRWLSHRLTLQLLETFNNQSENIHLITCCVTELNDVVKKLHHCPAIYGIAVDVKTGEIFHATFPEKGPDEDIRSARSFMGGPMLSIYDAKMQQMQIGPYEWTHFPDAEFWLQQSDAVILQNMSTSPLVEPPHFVKHIKSTLQFLNDHPVPDDSLFPNGRSRIYKKNAQGLWERIDGLA
ncbi:protein N-terminal asparagine amidohydrolase isoform X2 [Callorhinchus milii]|nr:protein N-terminal asparagine amidohydrolase isoform X2 [Callorhinchus milii]|eukprot:gi/632952527/ref/XP_007891901.1/ PREDICTED: protein N-terminal asparagine amidohydrolase isoform X2 [Callorhinchus milii]